ncbi:MAG: tRNA pseudouridine(38-40) synthase TruA [Candidatus Rokubacteria bacterium]|nr:tRNA pseudouridine(38-40) synthase TruA [Candidatus Rokubacteria bacterium]
MLGRAASASGITMPRSLRLTLAYDGTGCAGWQVQPRGMTVQGLVLDACRRILGESVRVVGASRTDAGVHALGQVASVATGGTMAPAVLRRALNAVLPDAVRVREVTEAPPGFDARRQARGKRYLYLIDRGAVADPFLRRYAWHVPRPLDAPAMARALRHVVGKRDFTAFCAAPGRDRDPTCHVRAARIVARRHRLAVVLSADRFLHHMVRNIVGSLVEVGRGARDPDWVAALIEGRDRRQAGPTAPARGLVLIRVLYHG